MAPLTFGGSAACPHFKGRLDEIRLWNVARTPQEILTNYRFQLDPATPGLVAYWTFDEMVSDQHVFDVTGHGHDGTLGTSLAIESNDPRRLPSDVPVGVATFVHAAPHELSIVPNPMARMARIRTSAPRSGLVTLRVFDVRGRLVRSDERWLGAGPQELAWESVDGTGRSLASGSYLLTLEGSDGVRAGRFVVVR